MEDKISTDIKFYLNNIELVISVTDKLTRQEGALKNFGYIRVSTGTIDEEECFWDNIDFFISAGKKEFKEECKGDLKKCNFPVKETYKTIKKLLKRAKKLKLLSDE